MTSALVAVLLFVAVPADGMPRTFHVGGTERQAIVFENAKKTVGVRAPLVFVFHGRGGQGQRAASRFKVQEHWPEAVVVYMQGLPGLGQVGDRRQMRTGWQTLPGQHGDRDLKFFDVALARLQAEFTTAPDRVYVLGNSNGARFVNVLWKVRSDKLAAICSVAAQGGRLIRDCQPKSIFMIMGERDNIVPFERQRQSIELARQTLHTSLPFAKSEGPTRSEPGSDDTELVIYIHRGGHEYPAEATPWVVKFFKRHKLE